ncbi:MAG: hypothetical protein WCV85_01255 [Patescibacteria group bacterium]|jgi:hypothetical protein
MQPASSKNLLTLLVLAVIFSAIGILIGWMTVGILTFLEPGLGTYWNWLGPLLGGCAGIGLFFLIQYIRKHPEGVH